MQVMQTALQGVLLFEPRVFGDERGFFFESFNDKVFTAAVGGPVAFVPDNHSRSSRGVLRGLHDGEPQVSAKDALGVGLGVAEVFVSP